MALTLITPPAAEPVTLVEAKSWIRVSDVNDDDSLIMQLITAARELCEAATGLLFQPSTWEWTGRCFPADVLTLPRRPLTAVVHVKWRDAAGTTFTLTAGADYLAHLPGHSIEPPPGKRWPHTGDWPDAAQVRWTAGYAQAPAAAKLAIKSLVSLWYEQREPVADDAGLTRRVPHHVRALLASLRGGRIETELA